MEDEILEQNVSSDIDVDTNDYEGDDVESLEDDHSGDKEGGEADENIDDYEDEGDDYNDYGYDDDYERLKAQNRISELEKELTLMKEEKESQSYLHSVLKEMGYGKGEASIADELNAQRLGIRVEEAQKIRQMEEARVSELVKNHPAIKKAEEIQRRQEEEMLKMRLEDDVRQIQEINPNIKAISDLKNDPNADIIQALVNHQNLTWAEAYKRVYTLTRKEKAVDTKGHLTGMGGNGMQGAELADIPPDERAVWEGFYPNLSPNKLKQKYNQYLKKGN